MMLLVEYTEQFVHFSKDFERTTLAVCRSEVY